MVLGGITMITYSFSIQGKSHIEGGVVCQDSSKVGKLTSGFYMGIVADGIGSAVHSDIGSDLAVKNLFAYCKEHVLRSMKELEIEHVLLEGYGYAYNKIEKYVKDNNGEISEYDTTLSAVIFNGNTVVYGHSGDGGIVVRCQDGSIKPITNRQKGADGISVRPLRAGSTSWEFGNVKGGVASVLLATDGMLDGVIQPVLVNLPPDRMSLVQKDFVHNNVYVTAAEFFMNPYDLYLNKTIKKPDVFMSRLLEGNIREKDLDTFLRCIMAGYGRWFNKKEVADLCKRIKEYYYVIRAISNVTDDKSIVCIMKEKVNVDPQEISFYYEPNWAWRQESYNALLYGQPMPPAPSDEPSYRDKRIEFAEEKTIISGKEEKRDCINIEETKDSDTSEIEEHIGIRKLKRLILPVAIVFSLLFGVVVGFIARTYLLKVNGDAGTDTVSLGNYRNDSDLKSTTAPDGKDMEEELNKQEIFKFLLCDFDTMQKSTSNKELQNKADQYLNCLEKLEEEDLSSEKCGSLKKEIESYIICLFKLNEKKESVDTGNFSVGEDIVSAPNDNLKEIEENEKGISYNGSTIDQMIEIMQNISESKQEEDFLLLLRNQLEKMEKGKQEHITKNLNKIINK